MALSLSIDKEALLDFLANKKDEITIVILLILLSVGGWYLYQQSSQTPSQIIQETREKAQQNEMNMQEEEIISPEEIVTSLTEKPPQSLYSPPRNPFGSPEEQLRMREEVQNAYSRGVELFQAGEYEQAIEQFERVITLDVTETRIQYPVLPSEYKRRAQQENARENFDTILSDAQSSIEEGDRLLEQNQAEEALSAYTRADEKLSEVIQSDTDGDIIGQENLRKVKTLQQEAFSKAIDIRKETLLSDMNQAVSNAQQSLQGNDYIALLRSYYNLSGVQMRITSIDPNAELIGRTQRDRISTLLQNIQTKIQDNVALLIQQAESQFQQALTDKDLQASQEAIFALRQVISMGEGTQELNQKLSDFVSRRAEMIVQMAEDFVTAQKQILRNGNYSEFDSEGKLRFLQEIVALREVSGALSSTLRNQLNNVETQLKALRLPPPLTADYNFTEVSTGRGNNIRVEYSEKGGRTTRSRTIIFRREGDRDISTKISLKQVDTDNGFVILSKSGYVDTKVQITSSN